MTSPTNVLYTEAKKGTADIKDMLKTMVETVKEVEGTALCSMTAETITELILTTLNTTFEECKFDDNISKLDSTADAVKTHMGSKVRMIVAMWLYVNVDPHKAIKKFG